MFFFLLLYLRIFFFTIFTSEMFFFLLFYLRKMFFFFTIWSQNFFLLFHLRKMFFFTHLFFLSVNIDDFYHVIKKKQPNRVQHLCLLCTCGTMTPRIPELPVGRFSKPRDGMASERSAGGVCVRVYVDCIWFSVNCKLHHIHMLKKTHLSHILVITGEKQLP